MGKRREKKKKANIFRARDRFTRHKNVKPARLLSLCRLILFDSRAWSTESANDTDIWCARIRAGSGYLQGAPLISTTEHS